MSSSVLIQTDPDRAGRTSDWARVRGKPEEKTCYSDSPLEDGLFYLFERSEAVD